MKMLQLAIAGVFLCLLSTGCDTLNGVYRTAHLKKQLPSKTAVESALHDVPEIQSVYTSTSQPISSSDPRVLEEFVYSSAQSGGVVAIQQNEIGEKTLTLYRVWMNYVPPPKVVMETCVLMDKVYASLLQHIPELPPKADLEEKLVRVRKE